MNTADNVTIHPCRVLAGTVRVPGDKSISHRVAMLSCLTIGPSRLTGFLRSEDCLNTLKAMECLGARLEITPERIQVTGRPWACPRQPLDMGNSGTGLRLLAGLLAGRPWTTELTGDQSLRSRPMQRIQAPLEQMGARFEMMGAGNCAPIRITGGALRGIAYPMPVASAQVKSCILLAALFAEGETRITEPLPTRDHTERALGVLGLPLRTDGNQITIRGYGPHGPDLTARDWTVPGDFSSAAFWLVAAAVLGTDVTVQNVGLNPRRTALLDVLKRMGADLAVVPETASLAAEPSGAITIRGADLRGTDIGGAEIPNLIDELPIVAVAGALAHGTTVIRDARELRVKESDRIACMVANLRALGIPADERADGMCVSGGATVRGGVELDCYGDHRVAMAMAILALGASAPVRIRGIACVNTSYPEFWQHLTLLGAHVEYN
ncbi:MAG: 3-phosphoshikimate 1-carboxyvinyltransferase [Verrucomicrobia bacterium]|nr:3-phosphoshikimate 1-carboxyvinyltransferase [Verrucomicrobiota bacterium]